MGKVDALLGLDGLNGAGDASLMLAQQHSGDILILDEREALAVATQTAVLVDKNLLRHPQIRRDGGDIPLGEADVSLPSAAGAAALAPLPNC